MSTSAGPGDVTLGCRHTPLARAVTGEALAEGRATLVWSTYDTVPAADAFSRRLGGRVGRVNRNSELLLEDVDWELVQSWADDGDRRAPGYAVQVWDGPFPDDLVEDALRFHRIMNTQPRDDLEVGDVILDPTPGGRNSIAHLVESGRRNGGPCSCAIRRAGAWAARR